MPNLPPVIYASSKSEEYTTEVTVLSNGLRVASEKKFGQFCTAGGQYTLLSCTIFQLDINSFIKFFNWTNSSKNYPNQNLENYEFWCPCTLNIYFNISTTDHSMYSIEDNQRLFSKCISGSLY